MGLESIKLFENESARVKSLSFHPHRPWILASLHTGVIQLWDFRLGVMISSFQEHEGPVRTIAFHPSKQLFVSGGDDSKVKVWSPNMNILSAGSKNSSAVIKATNTQGGFNRSLFTLTGHLDYIRHVEFHSDHPWIISSSDDQTIRIWNYQARNCLSVLTGHNHYVMCARFGPPHSPAADLIASASLDQTIKVWDYSGLKRKSSAGAMSPDNFYPGHLSPGSNAQNLDLFAPVDVQLKYTLDGHDRGVNTLDWHPSGTILASGSDDRQVKMWQLEGLRAWELDSFSGHFNNISSVLFAYEGALLISNAEDKTMRFWDTQRRTSIFTIKQDSDRFWNIQQRPSSSGEHIFAASHDNGFFVFKLERERSLVPLCSNDLLFSTGSAFYTHGKEFKVAQVLNASQNSVSVCSIGTLARISSQSLSPAALLGENPSFMSFNPTDGSVLVTFTAGIEKMVEYYANIWIPSKPISSRKNVKAASYQHMGALTPTFKTNALSAFFLPDQSGRFVVLTADGMTLGLYASGRELAKSNPISQGPVIDMIPTLQSSTVLFVLPGNKLALFNIEKGIILFELQLPSIVGKLKLFTWDHSGSILALSFRSNHICIICLTEHSLSLLRVHLSDSKVKSMLWSPRLYGDEDILYLTTHAHLKYFLPISNETGLLMQLDRVFYLYAVDSSPQSDDGSKTCSIARFYVIDRSGDLSLFDVEVAEVVFKVALQANQMDIVNKLIQSGSLLGQSLISYLHKKGHSRLALGHVKDPLTRLQLSIETADWKMALEMAQKLDHRAYWDILGDEALHLGNVELAELAWKKSKNASNLFMLFIVTGQLDKLQRLSERLVNVEQDMSVLILCQLMTQATTSLSLQLENNGQDLLAALFRRKTDISLSEELKLKNLPLGNGIVPCVPIPLLNLNWNLK